MHVGRAIVVLLAIPLALVSASVSATPPPGDVNLDGSVDTRDAQLVLQFDAGIIATLVDPLGADVNYDGRINSLDALFILQVGASILPIDFIVPPRISVTSALGIVGQQVTVELEGRGYYRLLRWTIDTPYDSQVVQLQSCTPRTGSTCTLLPETSAVRVSGNAERGFEVFGPSTLATIEFRCTTPGTARLEPNIIELEASAGVEAGTVTCTSPP